MKYWLEKMFGDLSASRCDLAIQGDSFDIFGLPAQTEPSGPKHVTPMAQGSPGQVERYVLALDSGITAEMTICRPPASIARQHCVVRGRIDGLKPARQRLH